jgi:hypothetical protein
MQKTQAIFRQDVCFESIIIQCQRQPKPKLIWNSATTSLIFIDQGENKKQFVICRVDLENSDMSGL